MATAPRRPHLFIHEWMIQLGLTDTSLGKKFGVTRTTVWRWRNEQWRLDPMKIADLAEKMGISPQDLYRPPRRQSIDAVMQDASDDDYDAVMGLAKNLSNRKAH